VAGRDRELGMDRRITRRDFLNGVALTVGAAVSPDLLLALDAPYPPALTGLRGSHDGSWEASHALRDGSFWETAGKPVDTGEAYDLVVVGAGISGLSAAHFFRQKAGAGARILVLDNHDDFGGHARRNEFRVGRKTLLSYGGTFAVESPAPYSAVAHRLVADLGIDVSRFEHLVDRGVFGGLKRAVFFDRETFGADRLVPLPSEGESWVAFLAAAPLSAAARRDLARLYAGLPDPMPGLGSADKKARLARISYAEFLTRTLGLSPDVVPYFQSRPHGLYGVGVEAVSAQDAWGLGYPGFAAMGLAPGAGPGMGLDAIRHKEADAYFFHFPDGNASIARLLLRRLVPRAVPGTTTADVVTARADYGRLDEAGSAGRVRLRSTVVRVRHLGAPDSAREVEVAYASGKGVYTVRARHCVLACWHSVIPYLCAELPEKQKEALASATKVPLLYTSVALRNWTSFQKLGVHDVDAPGGFYNGFNLNLPVSIGAYRGPRTPQDPVAVHMGKTPCLPGAPARDQHRAGRLELLGTPFVALERATRDQLARALGPGGFDPARDIAGLTINRWPHGYAYQYNSLWDPFWLDGGEQPCAVARRPLGRIAIANADAAAYSYTDAAIDQAHRAVAELLA
jgi:spermidine dehydrogenase